MNPPSANFYEFGKFRLDAERCVLLSGNSVVDVTPKSLQILCVLVENGGRVVSKEELLTRVWSDSFVEEANLSHHIFRLRKALGEDDDGQKFIETVSKRGYRFVAEIRETKIESREPRAESRFESQTSASNLQNSHSVFRNPKTLAFWSAIFLILALGAAALVWFNFVTPTNEKPIQNSQSKIQNPMTISRVTSSGKASAPTISPDGKFIAYANYIYGAGTIFIRRADTNIETQLLGPDEHIFGRIAFSPDGTFIYYVVYDKRDPAGALYRISVLGGQPARILGNLGSMFTLSPDGSRAAFYRFESEQKQTNIVIAALDGSGSEQIVLSFDDTKKNISSVPAFSPDGKMLAFGLADGASAVDLVMPRVSVFTVELGSREIKRLTEETWTEIGMMNWMPDGSGLVFVGSRPRIGIQIYFLSYPAGALERVTKELNTYGNYGMGITADGTTLVADLWEGSAQIWAVGADGKTQNAVQLTSGDSDGARGLTSLPDGRIVYSSRTGFDFDLWTMRNRDGKREGKPLTSDAFFEGEVAAAAPDGKFLVFISDRAGSQHLFRINADGSNLKQLTFGDSFDSAPDVSPDGNWIVYAAYSNNQNRIWKIPIDGGQPVQLTDYESVSPGVSPDGKLIACVFPSDSRAKPARLDIVSFENGVIAKSFEVLPFDYYYRAPRWMPDGQAIIFFKNDKLIGNLWKQNPAGGEPKQLTDFKSELIYNFAFSSDGKRLLVSRGDTKVNVVMLKNFRQSF